LLEKVIALWDRLYIIAFVEGKRELEGGFWRKKVQRSMFKSKIHRATVTHADLQYEGSLTIDSELMKAANIINYEKVHLWNISRGTRLVTYAISGDPGSGVICANGAAAHLNKPGDLVIIATFADMDEKEARVYEPRVVLVDEENRIITQHHSEIPGPAGREEDTGEEVPSIIY